jgi:hypothetical protein
MEVTIDHGIISYRSWPYGKDFANNLSAALGHRLGPWTASNREGTAFVARCGLCKASVRDDRKAGLIKGAVILIKPCSVKP